MRLRVRAFAPLSAALVVVLLSAEASSLPSSMTLPATYRVRGVSTVVLVARYRGQTKTFVQ